MKPMARKLGITALGAVVLLLVAILAFSIGQGQVPSSSQISAEPPSAAMDLAYEDREATNGGAGNEEMKSDVGQRAADAVGAPSPDVTTERLVIRTANMDMRVADVTAALTGVRAAAGALGAEISDLTVVSGDSQAMAAQSGPGSSPTQGPATAYATLRVPADKLTALEARIAKLGTVLTQSSNSNDVTEQAIDMEARLNNFRAEEDRLRTFLDKTNKVSELLEVERELSRVRGEIEAMDAQLTYLKRQAARSTLTVTLSEPGPVVQPAGTTWGIREAVTRGIQAAASLVTTLITISIPLALLFLVIGIVAWPIRMILRRRAARRALAHDDVETTTGESETGE